jgi:Domain of unknown function (DUF927)
MTTAEFLQKVLPSTGFYGLTRVFPSGAVVNTPYATTTELAIAAAQSSSEGVNTFMALASFRDEALPHPDDESRLVFRRTQANAYKVKSLWLDIDIGADKAAKGIGYSDGRELSTALKIFLEKTKLPTPMLVSSGYGVHAYWVLDRDIPSTVWHVLANALKVLCLAHDFHADPSRTTDSASVLRPVGTYNYKRDTPKEVRILLDTEPVDTVVFVTALSTAAKPYNHLAAAPSRKPDNELFAHIPSHITAESNAAPAPELTADANPIIKGCQQIARMGFAPEPVWRAAITVLSLAKNGEAEIHSLSALDRERYDAQTTDYKIHQVQVACAPTGMPSTCANFNALAPNICTSCPNFGRIKSPIVLGSPKKETQEPSSSIKLDSELPPVFTSIPKAILIEAEKLSFEIPYTPDPINSGEILELDDFQFKLTKAGVIRIVEADPTDSDSKPMNELMCRQRIYPIARSWYYDAEKNKRFIYHWRVERAPGEWADYHIPGSQLHDKARLIANLGDWGVIVRSEKHHSPLGTYMRAYLNEAHDNLPEVQLHDRMGWDDKGSFVVGDRIYTPKGHVLRAHASDRTAKIVNVLTMQGSLDRWQEAFSVTLAAGQEHALFAVGVGFAAPLMRFTESRGFLVHMNGPKGRGKSTLQRLCNSIWGTPSSLMMQQPGTKTGDTHNQLMRKIGTISTLPVCLEEITNYDEAGYSEFVHMLAGGTERGRLTDTHAPSQWHTAFLSSGNMSLRSKLGEIKLDSEAEQSRFFELNIPETDSPTWQQDSEKLNLLDQHFGVAGHVYSAWLVRNAHKLGDMVLRVKAEIGQRIRATQADRFMTAFLAAHKVGLCLAAAAGAIQVTAEDLGRLDNWIDEQVVLQRDAQRGHGVAVRTVSLLGDMLGDMTPNTLVVARAKSPAAGSEDYDAYALVKPRSELWVRVEKDTGRTYITVAAARRWCVRRKISFDVFLSRIRKEDLLWSPDARDWSRVELGRGLTELEHIPRASCMCVRGLHILDHDKLSSDQMFLENQTEYP